MYRDIILGVSRLASFLSNKKMVVKEWRRMLPY